MWRFDPEGGGTENWGIGRKILSRGGSFYARTILGIDIRDVTGGFKCFRRRVLETLPLDRVQTQGYGFQIELTYRAIKAGFNVVRLFEFAWVFMEPEEGRFEFGLVDDALAVLSSVVKDPSTTTTSLAYIYHLLAKTWKKKGNSGKAILYYENLFARYPSYSYTDQAQWEAAQIYLETGDTAQARKLLEKLLGSGQYKDKAQKKIDSIK